MRPLEAVALQQIRTYACFIDVTEFIKISRNLTDKPCFSGWCLAMWNCVGANGPLVRYVKLWVAHAPGMLGTFSTPAQVSDPDMHHGTYVTHVPWCMPGSLTGGFHCIRWRGKRSRHSQRMRNLQFYVSGKRPIDGHYEAKLLVSFVDFWIFPLLAKMVLSFK